MPTNAILPPAIHMKETEELDSFFSKEKKNCKNNPYCKCGQFSWCAGREVKSPRDWRMEALSVAEQTAVNYRALQTQDKTTVPPSKQK